MALWSLAARAMHAAAVWAVSNAGALTGAASDAVSSPGVLQLPDWLALWVPPQAVTAMTSVLSGWAPLVDSLLQAAPALAGALTVASWVVWAVGSLLLLVLGTGLHLLIRVWRRHGGGGSGPHHGVAPA